MKNRLHDAATLGYNAGLARVREALGAFRPGDPVWEQIVAPRDQVLARFQPVLALSHIPKLTAEEFKPFLYLEHNHHWSSLYRTGLGAIADIKVFRKALAILLDEGRPISTRFGESLSLVPGMGKGIATAVLIVAYPERYGVWNNTSEGGLRKLGLWPELPRGSSLGERYSAVNAVLLRLAKDLKVDLWTLDALWWRLLDPSRGNPVVTDGAGGEGTEDQVDAEHFALEKQLEGFLVENWNRTELAKEWDIFESDGDPLAGNQFPTDIGIIDILARHKREPRWLVVELKRDQTTDQTVGQATRYMGWVKQNLAKPRDSVEALLIGRRVDERTRYAASMVPNMRLMRYEVSFKLLPEKAKG